MRRTEAWLLGVAGLAAAHVLLSSAPVSSHDWRPTILARGAERGELQHPIRDFSLTDHTGAPFSFSSLRGKVVLVAFVYTTCPDVCPLITASMRSVQQKLTGRERSGVFLLSITTDPEVDRPAVLKAYAERYRIDSSNWLFLTGEPASLSSVWKSFGVKVERRARGLVNHTALTALVDAKGVLRFGYVGASPDPEVILRDMRKLLGPLNARASGGGTVALTGRAGWVN